MKKFLSILCLFLFLVIFIETVYIQFHIRSIPHKRYSQPKPLIAYTFTNLRRTRFPENTITLGAEVINNTNSIAQMFYFPVPQTPGSNQKEIVSGLMNVPYQTGKYPVIVMFRGFVPQAIYKPGIGTQPVAQFLADNGFITLSPDFLGFGQSASPSADPFENRFQTYTTALSLLSSLKTLNHALAASYSGRISADLTKIGIWGHSNGGQIALTTLAISGVTYPTVLWAPVSASFPYSILYYTDESDDQGKLLRKTLAHFEETYDTNQFSPPNYYHWIKAPVEIDQGTNDHEVPFWWSDTLVTILRKNSLHITYNTYPGADHNMLPDRWSQAVTDTFSFYQQQFSKR